MDCQAWNNFNSVQTTNNLWHDEERVNIHFFTFILVRISAKAAQQSSGLIFKIH